MIWWSINVIIPIEHLAQCLAQSWRTLFLIYFRFVCCLGCPEFIMDMKCETTLWDLEITQILFLRDHKEESRQKVYLLLPTFPFQHVWRLSDISPIIINAIFQSKLSFLRSEKWYFFSFLAWIFPIWNDLGEHLSHHYWLSIPQEKEWGFSGPKGGSVRGSCSSSGNNPYLI